MCITGLYLLWVSFLAAAGMVVRVSSTETGVRAKMIQVDLQQTSSA